MAKTNGKGRDAAVRKGAPAKAAKTASRQRAVQQESGRLEAKAGASGKGKGKEKAVQAGTRRQPENPLPPQHLAKPGIESKLDPRPRYRAPD